MPPEVHGEYSEREERPLAGYTAVMATYGLVWAGLGAVLRRRGIPRLGPADLALATVATHKLSRIVTKDSITSPLRAPLVRYKRPAGSGELVEGVRVDGPAHALGELVICPLCMDVWVATAFTAGLALAPRATRLVASVLAVATASNGLHLAWDAVKQD